MTFGQALRKARLELGLSQDDFSKITGMHRTHISLLERGRREPTLETLVKLARGLGVSVGELVDAYARDDPSRSG